MNRPLIFIFLFLFCISPYSSQNFEIRKFTVEDGLMSNYIDGIFQDSKGLLWIKNGKGISCYDGKKITNYYDREPISGGEKFVELKDGAIHYVSSKGIISIQNGKLEREKLDSSIYLRAFKEKEAFKVANHLITMDNYHYFFFLSDTINVYHNGNIRKLIPKNFIAYDKATIIQDNQFGIWFCSKEKGSQKWNLRKINKNSFNPDYITLTTSQIDGIFAGNNHETLISNKDEIFLYNDLTKQVQHFKIPVYFEFYSDNIIRFQDAFWMPYVKGLLKIDKSGVRVIEDKLRKTICDSVREFIYNEKGEESTRVSYRCDDWYFSTDICTDNNGNIVTGNKIYNGSGFQTIFPTSQSLYLTIQDYLIDFENQIWYATSDGLIRARRSLIQSVEQKIVPIQNGIKLVNSTQKQLQNKELQNTYAFYEYENFKLVDSFKISKKADPASPWAVQDMFERSYKLKKGSIIIFEDEIFLKTSEKIERVDLQSYIHSKKPMKEMPGRWLIRSNSYFKSDDKIYFFSKGYYYSTDGESINCFGAEIGISDSIHYFNSPVTAINETIKLKSPLIATDNAFYSLENGKFIKLNSGNFFQEDVSNIFLIKDSTQKNIYLIREVFNQESKLYKLINNTITEVKVTNKLTEPLKQISYLFKTNNEYFFICRNQSTGLISFNEKIVKIDAVYNPIENSSTWNSFVWLHKDRLIIFPMDEPLKICKVDFKQKRVLLPKVFPAFNNFEATEVTNLSGGKLLFNYYAKSNDSLLEKKFTVDLNSAIFNPFEPRINILGIKYQTGTDTFEFSDAKDLKIPYNFNPLEIQYKGVCLSDGSLLKYRYKLEGIDKSWNDLTEDFVSYSTLPAGDYVFKVIACNNDGLWNAKPAEISFTILPPWYRTWWAYASYLLFGFAGIYAFIKVRTQKLEKEKRKLEETVEERTKEIVKQKHVIEEKQKEIIDSIKYAQRIQKALITSEKYISRQIAKFK